MTRCFNFVQYFKKKRQPLCSLPGCCNERVGWFESGPIGDICLPHLYACWRIERRHGGLVESVEGGPTP